jgi:D-alanyl-D-alanine carboxypeptidase/D-alanyl-D-alanine-endopeptidase (penicillin-binding protein 4)
MNRITHCLLLLLITSQLFCQSEVLPKKKNHVVRLMELVSAYPGFKSAVFAFHAIDLKSGEVIASCNSDKALKPGSTLKLLSTATALEVLGPDFQFKTVLEYTGILDTVQRILHGNIIIHGGGDPTLGSEYFDTTQQYLFLTDWVQKVKGLGIDSIDGGVIADASVYPYDMIPGTWTWANMGNYFGAGACGLSIFDNFYTVHFKTSGNIGDTAEITSITPSMPWLEIDNGVVADSVSGDNVTIYGAPYSNMRSLRGSLPLNRKDFTVSGSIPDPAFVAAFKLQEQLKIQGVFCSERASTLRNSPSKRNNVLEKRNPFFTTSSPLLANIIAQTNTNSINLFAEHCLIQSALAIGAQGETDKAIKAVLEFWKQKGMDIQGLSMNDGSGLSNYNVITPEQLVFLLQYMKNQSPYFETFYQSLAVAGVSGTLKTLALGSPAQGNLHGKSGTVDRAKAYAGYVTTKSGRELAFSMVVNNFSCTPTEATRQLEKLMVALATFGK